jgi:predicted metal-dependent hydrolase
MSCCRVLMTCGNEGMGMCMKNSAGRLSQPTLPTLEHAGTRHHTGADSTRPNRGSSTLGDVAAEDNPSDAARPAPEPTVGSPVATRAAQVEVRRSARRRRTVSAYREGDRTIVLVPARMSHAEERRWVSTMLDRLEQQERRRLRSDDDLTRRAAELSERYLGGKAHPHSVRWVGNQATRWGSCTPLDGTIRISDRVRGMPDYVLDYVLLHELAHLVVPRHGPDFWALLVGYPRTERARGYLEAAAALGVPAPTAPGDAEIDAEPPDLAGT